MSGTSTPRKRTLGDLNDGEVPNFEDPLDVVNAVISTLQTPVEKTNVAMTYANDKNLATEVQAYAKIAGQDWTYYVKSLSIPIGRNTDNPGGSSQPLVDIDLGPAKVVSRQHAMITYNLDLRYWELKVLGRNGARVDGQKVPFGENHSTPLHSGAILDIGGTQMMFILPDSPPNILQKMLSTCLAKYNANLNKSKRKSISDFPQQHTIPINPSNQIKSFQMFDKAQLTQSPSSASATSLQNNLDQDLSKEEAKDIKPPYSYATMITQAILSNDDGVMSLSEIYNWIASHYAYYKYSKTGWQNSIRHNLSLNKAFEKVPRRPNEPGKGMKWQISESYKEDFLTKIQSGSLLKARRGSSVSRQLQLHLATHQNLPESQKYYAKDDPSRSNSFDQRFNHERNSSLPKLGQPMQYQQAPSNPMQHNPLSYISNQQPQNGSFGVPPPRSYGYQHPPPPQLMYGSHMMHQNQNDSPSIQQVPGNKNELSSPIRQLSDINTTTPKLPKVSGNHLFNLPPPPPSTHSMGTSAPQAHHSRLNSYNHQHQLTENNSNSYNTSGNNQTSESNTTNTNAQNVSSGPTTNTSDLALGFTSPKKIAPLEAFTPERGSKSSSNKLGVANGVNTNQSSPAFWNFVQFSTPNAQTPLKGNDQNNQLSPTLNRRVFGSNGYAKEKSEKGDLSPLKSRNSHDDNSKADNADELNTQKNEEINA